LTGLLIHFLPVSGTVNGIVVALVVSAELNIAVVLLYEFL